MANQVLLVGTGVETIYACCLTSDGKLKLINQTTCGKGSTWLYQNEDFLYVVNEHVDKIETYSIDDRIQGQLTLKSSVSSIGNTPCSLDIDPSRRWLAVANYGYQGTSNFVLYPLNEFKQPDAKHAKINTIDGYGPGPHPDRQDHSYCHQVSFYNNYFYVVDLGTDSISIYRFDDKLGHVELVGDRVKTQPGSGPRHIIFHPTKPLAFVCNELNSTTNVYRVDNSSGRLDHIQTIKTRRDDDEKNVHKENYTAELQFTPDGKYLLVSNRGDENLVIFHINDDDNKEILTVKQHLDCQGSFTRYFLFDPSGRYLLIANQKSNNLICFQYNSLTASYEFVSKLDNIESPQHMVFLSQN